MLSIKGKWLNSNNKRNHSMNKIKGKWMLTCPLWPNIKNNMKLFNKNKNKKDKPKSQKVDSYQHFKCINLNILRMFSKRKNSKKEKEQNKLKEEEMFF